MPERVSAPWLDSTNAVGQSALQNKIVRRAMLDVGICEMPPGSNRSTRINEYVAAVGSPLGSFWCAAAVAAWFREAGAKTPKIEAGSCDPWVHWAKKNGYWYREPKPGYAVVYGTGDDAQHIGVVVRVTPILMSVEGNTSLGGYNRNGVAVDLKEVATSRVLGYIAPTPI